MNIEELIPKEIQNRKEYIKNILLDKLPTGIGFNGQRIYFKFETDTKVGIYDVISYKDTALFCEDLNTFTLYTDDTKDFLPTQYLIEEWKVI